VANVIPIQQERVVTTVVQCYIQRIGNGGFSGTAQPRKPQQARLLVFVLSALRTNNFVIVPNNIVCQNRTPLESDFGN
jgi:hypothetical protein